MRNYIKLFILGFGIVTFLVSCMCKTCKKEHEVTATVCLDGGTTTSYDNAIYYYQVLGYTCN